jgi:hypothetical protein
LDTALVQADHLTKLFHENSKSTDLWRDYNVECAIRRWKSILYFNSYIDGVKYRQREKEWMQFELVVYKGMTEIHVL